MLHQQHYLPLPKQTPRFQPQAVKLVPAEPDETASQPTVVLAHLDGLDLRRAADGWHGIWQADGVEHQFWLSQSVPDAAAFYEFTRTMQSYKSIVADNTTLVLSTGSDLFKFLKGMAPDSAPMLAQGDRERR